MSVATGELTVGGKFGDYTVEKLLGSGGMGRVYLIRGDHSGDLYAAKILNPLLEREDPEYKRRFIFEAELAMKIRHENLIAVFDAGRDPDSGLGYLLMEYVPGGTLRDRIAKWGALSLEESTDIVLRVARALVAVDEQHIVHRDIKPDNIMFTADGVTPKLADLGIARVVAKKQQSSTITQNGFMLGSPAYMAPEQMEDSHAVDIRADIHALGVTFWEMLAGERPYPDEDAVAIVARAMKGTPIPDIRTVRPDVPPRIADLIARMTRPAVEDRIATPLEIVQLLEAFRANPQAARRPMARRSTTATDHSKELALQADPKEPPTALYAVLAGLLAVGVILAVGSWQMSQMLRPAPPAPAPDPLSVLSDEAAQLVAPVAEDTAGAVAETNVTERSAVSGGEAPASAEQTPSEVSAPPAEPEKQPPAVPVQQKKPAAVPSGTPPQRAAAAFVEAIAPELRRWATYRRMAANGRKAEADAAVLDAVNAARAVDPDLRAYDLDGRSPVAWMKPLTPAQRNTLRTGKLFLVFELMRQDAPKWMEDYAREKVRYTTHLKAARPLSLRETVHLLGKAAGRDLTPLFHEFGIVSGLQ